MAYDFSSLIPSASPFASAGLDPQEALASDDPYGRLSAAQAGVPYQAKPGQKGTTLAGGTPSAATSPIGGVQRSGVSSPPDGGAVRTTDSPGSYALPRPQDSHPFASPQPADNAPNPPSEKPSGPQAVPASVQPSGGQPTMQSRFLGQKAQALNQAQAAPSGPDVGGLEQQRTAASAAAPNPNDPQYKPTLKSRFLRGLEGVGLGLAEGGLRGAIAGGIAPQTTGLAGYRDPNSAFSRAQQANQKQVSDLDQQIAQGNVGAKQHGEDVKNLTDIAKEAGSGVTQAGEGTKGPSIDDQYSAAVKDALDNDRDPSKDPKVQSLADAKTSLQKQPSPKEPSREDKAVAIYAKDPRARTPEESAFIRGYEHDVKVTKTDPGVVRSSVFVNGRLVPVAGDDDQVTYERAGNAVGKKSPQSVDFQSDKALQKDFTSGTDAKTLNSFNTAQDHLKILGRAADALHNGNTQLVNQVGNEWSKQTGNPAPTNFDSVKAAVAGEVSKVFKGGGATDAEISEINKTIQSKNSPAQLRGAIDQYSGLMESKRQALRSQYESGKKGQPNFGSSGSSASSSAETRTYQGHDYEKGSDGQWHRK